jgi:polysaccharide pyruvyl transferase WcaK-like protein
MAPRLIHLANHHSNNIGNGALILGTESVLREDLSNDIEFVPAAWDDYSLGTKRFDETFVEEVNRSDGLIVGGAVMFNGSRAFKHTGCRIDLPLDLWRRIARPIVFYGVAYGTFPAQRYHHRAVLKTFLEETIARPNVLFAARNDGSKGWLESVLGRRADDILSVPDPGLYVPTAEVAHPELSPGKLNVLLALNGETECYRFGGRWPTQLWEYTPGWKRRKMRFLTSLAGSLETLSQRYDVNIVVCAHSPTDFKMLGEFFSVAPSRLRDQRLVMAPILRAASAPHFYDLYKKADLAISMRIHSMDCATGVGTPFIAINSHPRIGAFMTDAGLEEFVVNLSDPGLADTVAGLAGSILDHRSQVSEQLRAARARMRARTREFNTRIGALLGSSPCAVVNAG